MPYPRWEQSYHGWERRPRFREPHPVRFPAVAAGVGCSVLWYMLFGLIGGSAVGYAWSTIAAGVIAALTAVLLARRGDRGVAVGVAAVSGVALSVMWATLMLYWSGGDWLLW